MIKETSIYLRELVVSDVTREYESWFTDESVIQFLEVRNPKTEDLIDFIKNGKETGNYFLYAICLKETGKHIGNLKIGPIDHKHKIADMPVVIGDKKYWGKGLAAEAIKLGNDIAFNELNIRKLSGGMYEENVASLKTYEKAGWVLEARLRGHYILNGKTMDRLCIACFNPKYFP